MRFLLFSAGWTFFFTATAMLLWKLVGSRRKLYYLFFLNMLFLAGFFLLADRWLTL